MTALRPAFAALLATLLLSTGCGRSAEPPMAARVAAMAPAPAGLPEAAPDAAGGEADTPQKYLAERQYWVFELPEKEIEARWQAHLDLCKGDCEVLNASIEKSDNAPVSAHLEIRVGRPSAAKLLGAMAGTGIAERRVEREDKTLEVVDVEARLKNQVELRDRLRALLADRSGPLKDILETERELARVQGDLDALASQRKVLANETEKILVSVDYRPEPTLAETGAMEPLAEAWGQAGHAFAASLAGALMFVVQALPWLIVLAPVYWLGRKLLRRLADWRRRRKGQGA